LCRHWRFVLAGYGLIAVAVGMIALGIHGITLGVNQLGHLL